MKLVQDLAYKSNGTTLHSNMELDNLLKSLLNTTKEGKAEVEREKVIVQTEEKRFLTQVIINRNYAVCKRRCIRSGCLQPGPIKLGHCKLHIKNHAWGHLNEMSWETIYFLEGTPFWNILASSFRLNFHLNIKEVIQPKINLKHFDTYLLKTRHAPVPTHNGQAGLTALFLVGVETMTDQGRLTLMR